LKNLSVLETGISVTNLANEILSLYKESRVIDLTVTVGQSSFGLHKSILFARCPKFLKQYLPKHQKDSIAIGITTGDKAAFELFFYFVYQGSLSKVDLLEEEEQVTVESLKELIRLAETYDFPLLVYEAVEKMRQTHSEIPGLPVIPTSPPANPFEKDIAKLYKNSKYSDIFFLLAPEDGEGNSEKVSAHKAILSARSEYFAALFTNQWTETKNKELKIEISSPSQQEAFFLLLEYIYSQSLPKAQEGDVLLELVAFSTKYLLDGLKIYCERTLSCSDFIDTSNCAYVLQLADFYGANELKYYCILFIGENLKEVKTTSHFATLSKPLVEEITEKAYF